MKLRKIISGGQTGADQAGLRAAKWCGLETGGWCPAGHRTELGPCPALEHVYGLRPHRSRNYPPRTQANVFEAQATVWFGGETSPGFLCTRAAAIQYRRPFFVNPTSEEIRALIEQYEVINVAGNSESRQPGIGRRVEELLTDALGGPSERHQAPSH